MCLIDSWQHKSGPVIFQVSKAISRVLLTRLRLSSQNQPQRSFFGARKIGTKKQPNMWGQLPNDVLYWEFRDFSIDDRNRLVLYLDRDAHFFANLQQHNRQRLLFGFHCQKIVREYYAKRLLLELLLRFVCRGVDAVFRVAFKQHRLRRSVPGCRQRRFALIHVEEINGEWLGSQLAGIDLVIDVDLRREQLQRGFERELAELNRQQLFLLLFADGHGDLQTL